MAKQSQPRSTKRKGGVIPALCNILGTLILVAVIASCLPVTVPRLFGYEIYNVVSGSMAPEIPVGSILYVERCSPLDVEEQDVIAFQSASSVITHRVVKNDQVEGEFITKGDANAAEDMNSVEYDALIGRVKYHFPFLGGLMALYTSGVGKAYIVCFAACGAMLNLLAGRLRDRRADRDEDDEDEPET